MRVVASRKAKRSRSAAAAAEGIARNRRRQQFELAMKRMAADPAIRRVNAAIQREASRAGID